MTAGLLALLAILPIHIFGFELAVGGVVVLLLLWSVTVAIRKRSIIVWSPLHWLLLAFLAVCLLQIVPLPFAPSRLGLGQSAAALPASSMGWRYLTFDQRATTEATIALATLIGYFFVALSVLNSRNRLRLLVNWLITVGFVIATLWMVNRFSPSNNPLLVRNWPLGFFFWKIEYVGLLEMILPLPLALILARAAKRDQVVLYGFAAIVMGVAVATANRTGGVMVLGLELLALVVLVMRQRGSSGRARSGGSARMWNIVGILAIIGSLIAGVTWMATRSIPKMISSDVSRELKGVGVLEGSSVKKAYYTRLVIWKTTLQLVADHPLLGVGLGAFPTAYTRYDPAPGLEWVNATHNDYLQLLSETGLVGGALLVLFLIFLVHVTTKGLAGRSALGRAVALGAGIGCFGILAHSLVDFFLQTFFNALVFFVLIALLLIAERQDLGGRVSFGRSRTARPSAG